MKILDALMGRRKQVAMHRTIDGGHPAPYADMTDEQLYNYEAVFNVANKTFDKPPVSPYTAHTAWEEPTLRHVPGWNEAEAEEEAEATFSQEASMASVEPLASALPSGAQSLDFGKPVRTITTHHPVEIITTRARHPVYKVHGYIGSDDIVTVFTIDGRLSEHGEQFLENAPEAVPLYLNIYENRDVYSRERYLITQHASREEADACATRGRLACISVQWDG